MPQRGFWFVALGVMAGAIGLVLFASSRGGNLNSLLLADDITRNHGEAVIAAAFGFGEVNIREDGRALLSGRAPEGAEVRATMAGRELGRAIAAEQGGWALTADGLLGEGTRLVELSAEMPSGETVKSEEVLVVYRDSEQKTLVMRAALAQPSRILQYPELAGPPRALTLELADFSAGSVHLVGRSRPDAGLVFYFDNAPGATTFADAQGHWQVRLPAMATGAYTLRIDEMAGTGKVSARIEVPFERIEPASAASALLGEMSARVVPGQSIWRIARALGDSTYQVAMLYLPREEYRRDASLDYPGQVLELPR